MTKQTISPKIWKTVKLEKSVRRILLGVEAPIVVNENFDKEMKDAVHLSEVEKEIKS